MLVVTVMASCGGVGGDERNGIDAPESGITTSEPASTARIVLAGDLMLGRGVAPRLAVEPGEVFAGVRHIVSGSDLAAANLESPLTGRAHVVDNPNALEADPAHATVVAAAGFDLLAIANNHALDAGVAGVDDTLAALSRAGIQALGSATAPTVTVEAGEVRVAWLAFDATGTTTDDNTLVAWDDAGGPRLIAQAAGLADVVIVGVHGGVEYHPMPSAELGRIAELAVAAGADVLWGHGAHVVQPITTVPAPGGRTAVVATSLGNLLFDQSGADRTTGALLELLVGGDGVMAYRVAGISHPDRVVRFDGWEEPGPSSVSWAGSWWTVVGPLVSQPVRAASTDGFRFGDVVAAGFGDVTGDGDNEVVVSFRRPFQSTPLSELRPDDQWWDADGRSAHLGVYGESFDEIWVAGALVQPVAGLAVCDGGLAVAYSALDDSTWLAAGALTWNGFGFDTSSKVAGPTDLGCADLDGDGFTEPHVIRR